MSEQVGTARLRALHAAATPGPIQGFTERNNNCVYQSETGHEFGGFDEAGDVAFFVAMHAALPALCDAADERDALRAELEAQRTRADALCNALHLCVKVLDPPCDCCTPGPSAEDAVCAAWAVLALLAPWSPTHGTAYTADRAARAGLATFRFECSRELGPRAMEV